MGGVERSEENFSVSYTDLNKDVDKGATILIDDGLRELEVLHVDKEKQEVHTKALNNGEISNHKGVNVPNVQVNLPGITEKDVADITFGIEQDVDFIAGSFVRTAEDRSEEHTSELQSRGHLVCRLLLEKKNKTPTKTITQTITN